MSRIQPLLNEYSESHRNETNKAIHWICVPLIMISLMGLLWSIPIPSFFGSITIGLIPMNWSIVFAFFALIYYTSLSIPLTLGMIIITYLFLLINLLLQHYIALPLWATSLIIFASAWIGQFYGHKVEGKKPSFLKDIQFLLIGPAWLLHFIYRKIGFAY